MEDRYELFCCGMASIGNFFPSIAPVVRYTVGDSWNGVWQSFKKAGEDINYAIQDAKQLIKE